MPQLTKYIVYRGDTLDDADTEIVTRHEALRLMNAPEPDILLIERNYRKAHTWAFGSIGDVDEFEILYEKGQ